MQSAVKQYHPKMGFVTAIVLATTASAYADAKKDVEQLVYAEAGQTAKRTDDAVVVTPHPVDFYMRFADKIESKVDKLVVVVDSEQAVAWYHASYSVTYSYWTLCSDRSVVVIGERGDKCTKRTSDHAAWRLSGVAINDLQLVGYSYKSEWKIAAVMWSRAVPDSALSSDEPSSGNETREAGDLPEAATALEGWFTNGSIAKNMSSSPMASANGTAPGEILKGAAAAKLAKVWDGLKMKATVVGGKQWGAIAFVRGEVQRQKPAVGMRLGAVLVQEHDAWRWVSLSLAPKD